jgi:uncharacterized coiled-coil protein SlyX
MQRKAVGKRYETITISFTDADEDIVELMTELKKANKASEFTREAIREKMNKNACEKKNNSEILLRVKELEEKIAVLESIIIKDGKNDVIAERTQDITKEQTNKQTIEDITNYNGNKNNKDVEEGKENNKDIKEVGDKEEMDKDVMDAMDFFDF